MVRDKKNTENAASTTKRYTFTLSRAGLISLVVACLVGITWIFILGVLMGRGYNPEKAVPQLTKIMPQPEPQKIRGKQQAQGKILKPEDLDFFDKLKQKKLKSLASNVAVSSQKHPQQSAAKGRKLNSLKVAESPQKKQKAAEKGTVLPAEDTVTYAYIYQVASLRDLATAQAYAQRLRKEGIKVSLEKATANGKTWNRILVHFTGSPKSTRILKEELQKHGISHVIMRARVPKSSKKN